MKIENFISIEGTDGSGKSTFIPILKEYLESFGYEVVLTREIGGTPKAEEIRKKVLFEDMPLDEELELIFEARQDHLENKILPLANGKRIILSDRYTDSTKVYQVDAKNGDVDLYNKLVKEKQGDVWPALTFVFVVPVEVSRHRLDLTGKTPDRFEGQGDEFFQKVIDSYKNIVENDPERCKLIDSSLSIEDTKRQVFKVVDQYFADKKKLSSENVKSSVKRNKL